MESQETPSSKEKSTRLEEANQASRDRPSAKYSRLRDTAKDKARFDWTHQYFQGKSSEELDDGYGCGTCTLNTPKVDFVVPFSDKGKIEVQSGLAGDESGSIRIIRGNPMDATQCDIFMVPFRHIEQVIVIPKVENSDGAQAESMHQVFIVPTGATGLLGTTKEYPHIIQFYLPNRKVDEYLKGTMAEGSNKETDTYYSVFKRVFNQQLAVFGKKVIGYTEEDELALLKEGLELTVYKVAATLSPIMGSAINAAQSGFMIFLDQGVLWVSDTVLWLPHTCFDKIVCLFMRDLASPTKKSDQPVVAMGVMIMIPDPAPHEGEASQTKMVPFDNIKDLKVHTNMSLYNMMHGIQMERLQQIFHDYSKGEPKTGFEPM